MIDQLALFPPPELAAGQEPASRRAAYWVSPAGTRPCDQCAAAVPQVRYTQTRRYCGSPCRRAARLARRQLRRVAAGPR